jgi:hypothetical protein
MTMSMKFASAAGPLPPSVSVGYVVLIDGVDIGFVYRVDTAEGPMWYGTRPDGTQLCKGRKHGRALLLDATRKATADRLVGVAQREGRLA